MVDSKLREAEREKNLMVQEGLEPSPEDDKMWKGREER